MHGDRRPGAKLAPTVTPVLIIVLCVSAEPDKAVIEALTRTVTEAIGGPATVQFRRVDQAPPDRELSRLAGQEGATLTATLGWRGTARREAVLRTYLPQWRRFEDRTLTFAISDRPAERGRALGLVIAAELPEEVRHHAAAAPPPPPPLPRESAQAPATPVTPPPLPSPGALSGDVAELVDSPPLPPSVIERASARSAPIEDAGPVVVAPPPPPPISRGWSMELGILGALGLHGPAAGLGGTAGMRWHASTRWSFHLGGRARVGQLQLAQASAVTLGLGPGAICRLWPDGPSRTSLSARADLLVVHESVSRFSSQQTTLVRKGHLRPGANALLELDFRVTDSALFGLAAGVEGVLARTDVVVHGARVAVLPPLRLITEAGLRVHF